jgi:hypothetical protein
VESRWLRWLFQAAVTNGNRHPIRTRRFPVRSGDSDVFRLSQSPLGETVQADGALAFSRAVRFAQPALVNGTVASSSQREAGCIEHSGSRSIAGTIVDVGVVADRTRLEELEIAAFDS